MRLPGGAFIRAPKETFAKYHKIRPEQLPIPEEQMVVCGVSVGYTKVESGPRLMPRADLDDFASSWALKSKEAN
ncbi:hypothetical protein [Bradyrhizobium sp. STM 3557]|uniref:hypothetical protein n=1 Tax=Bradyrhizobium sp. STM 3557 TaxID=578920 RepID=UPI00388F5F3F